MQPLLYEINTRCWLHSLSEQEGRAITLKDVPDGEFARWQELGFTHIWLMGVWTTGPKSRAEALKDPRLPGIFNELSPGWRERDVLGSPYAIANYQVPRALGGESGLRMFRTKLKACGLKLMLDFVPNHVGLDHLWVTERPELFVQSPTPAEGTFSVETATGTRWLAHGRDPYFAPWTDTVQLDYRRPSTRLATSELLQSIAQRCDGVRCDMAMLILNEVFPKTWEHFPNSVTMPPAEFWSGAIAEARGVNPDFVFLAEAYWGLESRLQALGFDYTYDKHVCDCLVEHRPAEVQRHLLESPAEYTAQSAHFLENHDEKRVASVLSPAEQRAAALVFLGLPGMRFLHEGQLSGARAHLPVQFGCHPGEPVDPEVAALYSELFAVLKDSAVGRGEWKLLRPEPAWADNPTSQNFVVVQWQFSNSDAVPGFELVVVNLAAHRSQCRVRLSARGVAEHDWEMRDRLGAETYQRRGAEMAATGLFLDLPGNGAQLFRFQPSVA